MSARAAPVLETARLILRPFRQEDLDAQAKTMGDPDVVRHLGGTPFSREDTWRRLLCAPGLWTLLGSGYWAITARDDGRYLGQLGFADFKREMTPRIERADLPGAAGAGDHSDHRRGECGLDPGRGKMRLQRK